MFVNTNIQKVAISIDKRQIASVHEGKKPFYCKICKPSFSEKGNMVLHISAIHEGRRSPLSVTCVLLQQSRI